MGASTSERRGYSSLPAFARRLSSASTGEQLHVSDNCSAPFHLPERCFSWDKLKNLGNHLRGRQFASRRWQSDYLRAETSCRLVHFSFRRSRPSGSVLLSSRPPWDAATSKNPAGARNVINASSSWGMALAQGLGNLRRSCPPIPGIRSNSAVGRWCISPRLI